MPSIETLHEKAGTQMAKIIRAQQVIDDNWNQIQLADSETPSSFDLSAGLHLFPLALWKARKQEIISRYKRIGIWLDSSESAESIADDLHYFQVVGIHFPKFADGRGYSTGRLLRERYGYEGEVRALGDVLQDQLFYLKRCGFDSFALRADRDIEEAVAALADFPDAYQAAADEQARARRLEGRLAGAVHADARRHRPPPPRHRSARTSSSVRAATG